MKVRGDRTYTTRLQEPGKSGSLERNFHSTPLAVGDDITDEDVFYEVLQKGFGYGRDAMETTEYIVYGVLENDLKPGEDTEFSELSDDGIEFVRKALQDDADELFFRFNAARY